MIYPDHSVDSLTLRNIQSLTFSIAGSSTIWTLEC